MVKKYQLKIITVNQVDLMEGNKTEFDELQNEGWELAGQINMIETNHIRTDYAKIIMKKEIKD